MKKKKYVQVGIGGRSDMFLSALMNGHSNKGTLCAVCDINTTRMSFQLNQHIKQYGYKKVPMYKAVDFDKMIKKHKPDTVIVTTMDRTHDEYICRAMELGCDVITEKPMTTDEVKCQRIIDTIKKTGRDLRVTFNYRYSPISTKVKETIFSGAIGDVLSINFEWLLDTKHGADYFRRWHRDKSNSGGQLVHKSTHHFDLLNWWVNAEPMDVYAYGELRKYGWNSPFRGTNCRTCQYKNKCEFYWDITKDKYHMDLYAAHEHLDGYIRDSCLFRKKINIWDTMAVQVKYHNEVMLSYSLNAFMPYEGYRVGFNGTRGRLDAMVYHNQPWKVDRLADFRVTPLFGESRTFAVSERGGSGHWGSDERMQDMIFKGPIPDPLGQAAGSRQGAMSILIGIAARRSIENQRPFKIEELVKI